MTTAEPDSTADGDQAADSLSEVDELRAEIERLTTRDQDSGSTITRLIGERDELLAALRNIAIETSNALGGEAKRSARRPVPPAGGILGSVIKALAASREGQR
jgi:hypothetical protein